jgi:hypothetical protein
MKIGRRTSVMRVQGLTGDLQQLYGHKLAKRHGLGKCANRGCWLCAIQRNDKREKVRRARRAGHHAERSIE